MLCSEDLPAVAGATSPRMPTDSLFGTAYADVWRAAVPPGRRGRPRRIRRRVSQRSPALILSGGHDPVTPPRTGELMSRHFPRHRHVVVPAAAHNASFTGCVPDLIAAFLAHGDGDALDDARASADVAWPPFVVATAGTRP